MSSFHSVLCYWWAIGLHWWCQIEIDKKCKRQFVNSDRVRNNCILVVNIGLSTIYVSKPSCFENLQIYLYVTSEIYFVTGKLTCSERTNSRKASRGGSVSTHINRRKFDSVHRSVIPFRDTTRKWACWLLEVTCSPGGLSVHMQIFGT